MIRLLLAGEGPDEIGLPAKNLSEGERPSGGGVIEALLAKVRPAGWQVTATVQWKDVHKLRPNVPGSGDARTVQVLAMTAREQGCNALVFLRDRDRSIAREREIAEAVRTLGERPLVACGVPVEMLESWLLALEGETGAERESDPVGALESRYGVPAKRATAMVQLVRNASLLDVPADAPSLWRWLRSAATALSVRIPPSWR